jgi:hypothetical protein
MVEVATYGAESNGLTSNMIDRYAVVFQRAQNSLAELNVCPAWGKGETYEMRYTPGTATP